MDRRAGAYRKWNKAIFFRLWRVTFQQQPVTRRQHQLTEQVSWKYFERSCFRQNMLKCSLKFMISSHEICQVFTTFVLIVSKAKPSCSVSTSQIKLSIDMLQSFYRRFGSDSKIEKTSDLIKLRIRQKWSHLIHINKKVNFSLVFALTFHPPEGQKYLPKRMSVLLLNSYLVLLTVVSMFKMLRALM